MINITETSLFVKYILLHLSTEFSKDSFVLYSQHEAELDSREDGESICEKKITGVIQKVKETRDCRLLAI